MPGQRIMIMGCSGAGKSTLARTLGARAGLTVTHLDALYWQAGWVEDAADYEERALAAANGERWVIDGSYSGRPSFDRRVARADSILLLDFPRWLCLWRVLLRTARWHGQERPDMAPGCPERFDWPFLGYIWNWRRVTRPKALARLAALGRTPEILRGPRDVARFLRRFETRPASAEPERA